MRPNNRQRSRGGRNGGGGGGGGGHHHKQQHNHNPNRPPNRNQIFDSSGPDVRVRGNAHQVFDKYQALAREAASSGDRIMAEAYWQYADHYFRMIQTMGGFVQRNNQGWGERRRGPAAIPSSRGRAVNPSRPTATAQGHGERQGGGRDDQGGRPEQSGREDDRARASPASAASLSSRTDAQRRRTMIRRRTSSPRCRNSRRPRAAGAAKERVSREFETTSRQHPRCRAFFLAARDGSGSAPRSPGA